MATSKPKMARGKNRPCVYSYDSAKHRHNGKQDVCSYIPLKIDEGKMVWGKVRWASKGYTARLAAELWSKCIGEAHHQWEEVKTAKDIRAE